MTKQLAELKEGPYTTSEPFFKPAVGLLRPGVVSFSLLRAPEAQIEPSQAWDEPGMIWINDDILARGALVLMAGLL